MTMNINTFLIITLGRVTNLFPFKLRVAIGKFVGQLFIVMDKKRKNITYNNIKNAFPNKSDEEVNYILKKSYQNLGITLIELLYIKKLDNKDIGKYIEFENIELINEVNSRGKGTLILSGHYGNWEYLAYSASILSGQAQNLIVKAQKNKKLDKILNEYRSKSGNRLIPMNKAAFEIVRIFKNKGMVALLADQAASLKSDIFVDFFNRPAITFEAPAKLALKFDIPILMGFAERQENYKYKVKLFEIKYDDIKGKENAIELLTQRHVKCLEEQIIKNPTQWSWQHNRWKHIKD